MRKFKLQVTRRQLLVGGTLLVVVFAVLGLYNRSDKEPLYATGINDQLNFQARLLDDTGAVVPDGTYNMRFKIYQDGNGCIGGGTSPCSGTLEWTETRESTDKVTVKNGFFSVYLGSVTPFGTDVDWNQDALWLSIDIGGTGAASYDGEMLPFTRLSSTPYSINSGKLGGLSKADFLQLGQSLQVDTSTNASIAVNKTGGSGNIVTLQRGGDDVLLINNSGEFLFNAGTDSVNAFRIRTDDETTTVFNADTTNKRVGVNTAAPSASLHVQGSGASEVVSIVQGNSSSQTGDLTQFLNSSGETLARVDAGGNIVAALDPPATAPTAAVDATPGNLDGDYTYVVTFVTAQGETFAGPASDVVSPNGEQVDLTDIPTGPTGTKSRKLYRTTQIVDGVDTNWRFVHDFGNNTTTTYTDNTADTGLTYAPPIPIAPPQQAPVPSDPNSAGSLTGTYIYRATYVTPWGETAPGPISDDITLSSEYMVLKDFPSVPGKTATATRIYRTQAGGSTYYYNPTLRLPGTTTDVSGTITDPSVMARDDNNPDGSLNTNITPPTGENTTGKPPALTATLTGTPGNLFSPAVYVYGYTYVSASGAESPLSFTDSVWPFGADNQASITDISTGPPGTVARKLYRSFGINGFTNQQGPFALLATIGDNTTTTYHDNTDNATLRWNRKQHVGYVGSGITTNNLKVTAPQGTPPLIVSSTTQVDNLNTELLGGNDQLGIKDFTWNMDESLKHYRAAVANANNEDVVVSVVGDSITWGLALSDRRTRSTPALIDKALKEKYGDGGTGFQKAWDNKNWTQGSVGSYSIEGTDVVAGGGIKFCNNGSGNASMTIQFRGSAVDIHHKYAADLDTMHYVIDGGTKSGDLNQSVGVRGGVVEAITGLDPSKTHTMVLTVNGASGNCATIAGIDAKFDTGIRVNNLATSSTFASTAYDTDDSTFGSFNPTPDLVVVAYGTNEHGGNHTPQSFKSYYSRLIGQAKRTSKPADCILIVPAPQYRPSQRYDQEAFRDMIYQVAEDWGCGVVDLYRKWGEDADWARARGLYNDGVGGGGSVDVLHLSDKGVADVASTIIDVLDNGVRQSNEVAASNEITLNGGQFSFTALSAPQDIRSGTTTSIVGGSLTNGATYRYVATALNEYGESPPSSETSSSVNSNGVLIVNWKEVPGATKYRLYRCSTANCASGSGYPQYIEVGKPGTYDDGNLTWKSGSPPASTSNSSFQGTFLQGSSTTALNVTQVDGSAVFNIDSTLNENNLIANSGFELDPTTDLINDGSFEQDSDNWALKGSATITRSGTYAYHKSKSLAATTTAAAGDGVKYNATLSAATYELSFWARTGSGSGSVLQAGYASDGSTETNCTLNSSSISTAWANYVCIFTVSSTSGSPYVYVEQSDSTARTIYLDKVTLKALAAPTGWSANSISGVAVHRTEYRKNTGNGSMQIITPATAQAGAKYPIQLTNGTSYKMSMYVRNFPTSDHVKMGYSADGTSGGETDCQSDNNVFPQILGVNDTYWVRGSCTITPSSSPSAGAYIYIRQHDAIAKSIYVDNIMLEEGSTLNSYSNGTEISLNGVINSQLLLRGNNAIDAFDVQNASGSSIFRVDTISSIVYTNTISAANSSGGTASNLVLDAGDSSGFGTGGNVNITSGGGFVGGNINLTLGTGSFTNGQITMANNAGNILRVTGDTSLARDQYRVTVGRGDATYPEGLARDQLYVFGRINSSWQMWWEDCMVAKIGSAATANGAMGGFSRGGGTTAQLAVPVTVASTSGVCRMNFNTPAANSTGIWGSGFTSTERSLNPVLEARVSATSNNDQRVIVGFTDLAAASSITTDTNQSANEAFFRKQAAGTNWEVVTRNGSGTETITTTALSTSAYRRLRVEMDDAGAQVKFYIDGTLAATHSDASVPATATRLSFSIINNVTATTSRNLDIDYYRVWSDDPIGASNEGSAEIPSEEEIAAAQNPDVYDAANLSFNFAGQTVEVAESDIDGAFNKLKAGEIYADTIFADKIKANQIEGLELLVNRLSNLPNEATEDTEAESGNDDVPNQLNLNNFKVTTAIIAEDLQVGGELFASGGLTVTGPAIFNGTSIFHRLATFVDKVIFQNDVQFKGTATFNNNTAGFATIKKTQQKVEIKFDPAFTATPVVTLTNKNGKFIEYAYKDLTEDGFTIVLSGPATEDIEFAWTAILVSDVRNIEVPLPSF